MLMPTNSLDSTAAIPPQGKQDKTQQIKATTERPPNTITCTREQVYGKARH